MNRMHALPVALLLAGCAKTTSAPVTDDRSAELSAIGQTVEQTLDRSADPCVDFYQFACGGWLESAELPADKPILGRGFSVIYDENQEVVKDILAKAENGEAGDPRLGEFYGACMDVEAANAATEASLAALKAPVESVKDADSLVQAIIDMPMANPLFSAQVEADFKNPDVNMLMVGQGGFALPHRGYYFPEDDAGKQMLADYTAHVSKMFELAGYSADEAAKAAGQVVAVETELARTSKMPVELRDIEALYNPSSLADFDASVPSFDWTALFSGMGLTDIGTLNNLTPDFFAAMEKVVAGGDWEAMRAYLMWNQLHAAANYLGSEFDAENFAFFGTRLKGQKEQQAQWRRCVSLTDGNLGDLLGQAFVDVKFAGDSKAQAQEMIRDIQDAFEAGLPELAWMDEATRSKAIEKLNTFTSKIGYPDGWEAYEGLVVGDDLYSNMVASTKWHIADELNKVGKPVDKAEWHMTPPTVNAYYNPLVNEIVFPAGIMQAPFFDRNFPSAMNYGAMGMVMGHEVTHGFDDEGRKFAPDGSLQDWWDASAVENFETATTCVGDLYSSFELQPGHFVNGDLTMGENIADLGGISLAYEAYQAYKGRGGADETVAGFTSDQLIFVAYAQSWCSIATEELERDRLETDPHSPPKFRVNGPLSQTRAFGEAFDCDMGEPMMPKDICQVW